MNENEIASIVFDCSRVVLQKLGPGLLESTYEECLCYELRKHGLLIDRQKGLPIIYDDIKLNNGYRIDIMVEDKVIVELKAVEALAPIHAAQLLTYLRLSQCKLGLLINFNVEYIGKGFKRIVNGL